MAKQDCRSHSSRLTARPAGGAYGPRGLKVKVFQLCTRPMDVASSRAEGVRRTVTPPPSPRPQQLPPRSSSW